jgi:hypothetical protein
MDIDQLIQKLEAENARLREVVESLTLYVEHETHCLCSQCLQGRPTDDGYERLFGYGKQEKWYKNGEEPECSCGLSNALALIAKEKERK